MGRDFYQDNRFAVRSLFIYFTNRKRSEGYFFSGCVFNGRTEMFKRSWFKESNHSGQVLIYAYNKRPKLML